MPAGNAYTLHFALQSAKGTPATYGTSTYKIDVTGSDLGANAETETRAETGSGRDQGDTYIRVLSAGGGSNIILRPKTAALFLYGVLGTKAVVASAPGYKHTLTPGADQPYFTVWREFPGFLIERFDDCKITGLNLAWTAGGDVTGDMTVQGLNATRLSSIPVGSPVYEQGAPFRMPGMVNTVEGTIENTQTQGNINIQAAQSAIQTVSIFYQYLEPGQRAIEFSYEQVMVDIARYAKSVYGAAAGTTLAQTMYEGTLKFDFGALSGAGPGLSLNIPRALFSPTNPTPDTGGDPLRLPVAGIAGRPIGGGNVLSADVYNDVATY